MAVQALLELTVRGLGNAGRCSQGSEIGLRIWRVIMVRNLGCIRCAVGSHSSSKQWAVMARSVYYIDYLLKHGGWILRKWLEAGKLDRSLLNLFS